MEGDSLQPTPPGTDSQNQNQVVQGDTSRQTRDVNHQYAPQYSNRWGPMPPHWQQFGELPPTIYATHPTVETPAPVSTYMQQPQPSWTTWTPAPVIAPATPTPSLEERIAEIERRILSAVAESHNGTTADTASESGRQSRHNRGRGRGRGSGRGRGGGRGRGRGRGRGKIFHAPGARFYFFNQ